MNAITTSGGTYRDARRRGGTIRALPVVDCTATVGCSTSGGVPMEQTVASIQNGTQNTGHRFTRLVRVNGGITRDEVFVTAAFGDVRTTIARLPLRSVGAPLERDARSP